RVETGYTIKSHLRFRAHLNRGAHTDWHFRNTHLSGLESCMFARTRTALRSVVVLGVGSMCAWGVAGELPPPPDPGTAADTDFRRVEQELRIIRAQKLTKEVMRTIDAALKTVRVDADAAYGELKRALTTVLASSDIDPDVREKLRVRLQGNIEQVLTVKRR